MANTNKKSSAYLGPRDLSVNPAKGITGPGGLRIESSDASQDRDQVAAPELRQTSKVDPAGWPSRKSYMVARMHIDLDYKDGRDGVGIQDSPVPTTDGKGKMSPGYTARGPKGKGVFDSNRSARIPRNTFSRRGNTG